MSNATRRVPRTLKPKLQEILDEAHTALDHNDWRRLLEVLRVGAREITVATGQAIKVADTRISSDGDQRHSSSLQTGIAILALFEGDPERLYSLAAIADQLGMSRSTTHRYLQTLVATGQLTQPVGTRRYRRVHSGNGAAR